MKLIDQIVMAKGSEYCWRVQLGFLVFVLACLAPRTASLSDLYERRCRKAGASYANCQPYQEDTGPSLSDPEAEVYNDMASMLKIPTPPQASSICNNKSEETNQGIDIECHCQPDCHVTKIDLWNLDLGGVVPASLCNFTYLEYLDLSFNELHDGIPECLGNLSSLQFLDLSRNQLVGSIPASLGNLTKLKELDLSRNQLIGSIPASLGNLTKLKGLDLSFNLLNGTIPPSFDALKSLQTLNLAMNMLSGPIPDILGTLTQLSYLNLDGNQFSGTLPSKLANLRNLEFLKVASNKLNGSIPDLYAQLTKMFSFSVAGNYMSGRIPYYKQWTELTHLDLMGNNFEGPLPPEIFKLPGLSYLTVSDLNSSSFQFPPSSNLTSIRYLVLRHCNISGEIPPNIGNMSSLQYLDLSFNNLTGGIPYSMQNLNRLSKISLAGNNLNGALPYWPTKKEDLVVDLSFNKFLVKKTFRPHNLSNMNLFQCCSPDSSINRLNMTSSTQMAEMHCPKGKSKYKSLFINCGGEEKFIAGDHYYADNDTSSYHVSEGQWAYSCSGQFMSDSSSSYIEKAKCGVFDVNAPLYETARICPVSLTYYGYCLQNGIYIVQLDFTEIVWTEEDVYSGLRNRIFDIYIQDVIKEKDFNIKERARSNTTLALPFTVQVTDSLLKIRLFWAGKGSMSDDLYLNGPLISAISAIKVDVKKVNVLKIALIVVASSVIAMLLLLFCAWKMGWLENKDLYVKRIELLGGSVTVKQLIDATRNFSRKMEIGKGGFGTVYRAELLNQIVAVKKLSSQSRQGMEEFNTEDFTLKTLRHENLVQLLGAYSGNNLHLLIYEYVENNSLAQALFESNSAPKLDWKTRYGICLGIAKGLKYLHEDSRVKIVHRDIKASNVLLDKDFKAKISDFGLAKLYDGESQSMVTKVGGTHGYMAPEYAMRGIFTYKADIYSFGVLLLEIVSGKNNAEQIPSQENVFLLDTAYVLHKEGRLIDLVDKRLSEYDREEAGRILSLGMICTSQSHTLRPTISQVVRVLEGDMTIEEVNIGRGGADLGDGYRNMAYRDTSVTDFSNTSTEGTSTSSSTSFFVIKESDEKMHRHDDMITPRHNLE